MALPFMRNQHVWLRAVPLAMNLPLGCQPNRCISIVGSSKQNTATILRWKQQIVEALDEQQSEILGKNCFIGSVQYFDAVPAAIEIEQDGYSAVDQLHPSSSNKSTVDQTNIHSKLPPQTDINILSSEAPQNTALLKEQYDSTVDGQVQTRFIVCLVRTLILPAHDGEAFLETELRHRGALGIWRGEVDAIGHTSWRFGFARHQTFALFDCEQLLVEISQHQGIPGIVLYTASVEQSSEYFNIVTHSANELSEQNNEDSLHKGRTEQQCLDSLHGFIPLAHVADVRMRIRGCTKLLAVGTNEKDEIVLLQDEGSEDLEAMDDTHLMITSEWMMKTAGLLVATLQRFGYDIPLRLSRRLLPDYNASIAQRMLGWQSALSAYSDSIKSR
eukprot:gene7495-9802_t